MKKEKSLESLTLEEAKAKAIAFDKGDGVEANKEKAVEYFLKAAELGDATCFVLAGRILSRDLDNDAKALELYLKAAEANVPNAFNFLATAYRNGKGTEVDLAKAEEYAKKGVELGDFNCAYNLASWYKDGRVLEENNAEALRLYELTKTLAGYQKASDEVKAKIDETIADLSNRKEEVPAQKEETDNEKDSKGWILGFYIVLIVLGIAGVVLASFAASQVKAPGWFGLYGLFIPIVLFNVAPLAIKKIRFNTVHFLIDLGLAFLYIIAIVVSAIVWMKEKGI